MVWNISIKNIDYIIELYGYNKLVVVKSSLNEKLLNCILICNKENEFIINVINMDKEEQVEIQILQQGVVLNDTIYQVISW